MPTAIHTALATLAARIVFAARATVVGRRRVFAARAAHAVFGAVAAVVARRRVFAARAAHAVFGAAAAVVGRRRVFAARAAHAVFGAVAAVVGRRRVFAARAAAVALAALAAAPPAAQAWRRPVPGAVARAFAYSPAEPFVRGGHRGVDLRALPGATVRAACAGRVAFAGRAVVTLRCGPWRVTHLPLATFAVRAGERVREGTPLGTLAPSRDHRGLHVGVRRAGDPFGYVDPLRFLPDAGGPPVTLAPPGGEVPRVGPAGDGRPAPPVSARPPALVSAPAPPGVRVPSVRPPAPWPVWIGLALALLGAVGRGVRVRARNRRARLEPVASAP
jgi:murein DD-endopeptidase MepM/ murein hydrolase activator NlpD